MRKRAALNPSSQPPNSRTCTDPIVGAILSGWRYDISNISPEMRTDYENHLAECPHCRHRQHIARTIDVLILSVTSLSFVAFLLAAVVLHRVELLTHLPGSVTVHLRHEPVAISLEAAAIAGLVLSMVLSLLVAIAPPLPGIIGDLVPERVASDQPQPFPRPTNRDPPAGIANHLCAGRKT